ncbi:Abi family protein [Curtobacterium flaccumfaciens pv. flaccumfaciens]|nr:Abi family protein [Curtobacterium flaccumfaciens pv. flaccumfaciens]
MSEVKAFRSTSQQVALLEARGMDVGDHDAAVELLRRVSYYRFSGYWYSFRRLGSGRRSDEFAAGTRLVDVVSLSDFDARLRTTVFDAIAPIELAVRAALGHELGRLDPCAHLEPALLGVLARSGDRDEPNLRPADARAVPPPSQRHRAIPAARRNDGRLPADRAGPLRADGGASGLERDVAVGMTAGLQRRAGRLAR